jgi:hypothetical protein
MVCCVFWVVGVRFPFSSVTHLISQILRNGQPIRRQTAMRHAATLARVQLSVASMSFPKRNALDERMMASSSAEKRVDVRRSSVAERTRFL